MKSENVKKFGLVIVESLPENEKKTGFDLHSSITTVQLRPLPIL